MLGHTQNYDMASSSSLSLPTSTKYDVFINFRGEDVRRDFLSHLKKGLKKKNIDAFVDERLQGGQDIASALFRAIEQSDSSLIIFSENYANSPWPLEELVKIMDCRNRKKHIVIPVFYNIEPLFVRHQQGSYASAFSKYYITHKEKVQSWRSALHDAANLPGIHYSECSALDEEANLVEKIASMLTNLKAGLVEKIPPTNSNRLTGFGAYAASTSNLDAEYNNKNAIIKGLSSSSSELNAVKTSGTSIAATNYGQQQPKPLQYVGPYNYQSSVQYSGPYNVRSKMLISQNPQGVKVSETVSFVGPEKCNCAMCNNMA